MKKQINPPYQILIRRHLIKLQYGKRCYYHRPFTKSGPTRATIEHKKALMDGGSNELSNLAAACYRCNQHRGTQKNRAKQRAQREDSS